MVDVKAGDGVEINEALDTVTDLMRVTLTPRALLSVDKGVDKAIGVNDVKLVLL